MLSLRTKARVGRQGLHRRVDEQSSRYEVPQLWRDVNAQSQRTACSEELPSCDLQPKHLENANSCNARPLLLLQEFST